MGKHKCPNCEGVYYINPNVDSEYACPNCGLVEPDRMVGQKSGRRSEIVDE